MGISCFGADVDDWGLGDLSLDDASGQPITSSLMPLYDQSVTTLSLKKLLRDDIDKQEFNGEIIPPSIICVPCEMTLDEKEYQNEQTRTISLLPNDIQNRATLFIRQPSDDVIIARQEEEGEITPSSITIVPCEIVVDPKGQKHHVKISLKNPKHHAKIASEDLNHLRGKRSRVITYKDDLDEESDEDIERVVRSKCFSEELKTNVFTNYEVTTY
jgi:hypothetical protein